MEPMAVVRRVLRRSRALLSGSVAGCLLIFVPASAWATEPIIITSVSKQFVVRGKPLRPVLAGTGRDDVAYLDPATLAVTCERVKNAVGRELGWHDRWHGSIYINIRPVYGDRDQPVIYPFRTDRGFSYRVDMPDEVSRRALMETLVEALVLEFADRSATNYSAELPPWLIEGLTAHLSEGPLAGLALQTRTLTQISQEPKLRHARDLGHADAEQTLRERVQNESTLSVDQLNWPDFDNMGAIESEVYRRSSHLFVRELLGLPGGPDALSAMLAMLPAHLNWQTAFLRGFQPHFKRMLDVEKWWSLTLSQWKTHDSSVIWSGVEARQKLEEILYTPMEVRLPNETAPHVMPVALQTVIGEWEFERQATLLETKLAQLRHARTRCTPEFVALIDKYQIVLGNYLEIRAKPGRFFAERKARAAVTDAIGALNELDQQRIKIETKPFVPNTSTAQQPTPATELLQGARAAGKPLPLWSEPRPGLMPLPLMTP